ncbi:DUF6234 family protein [Streptomyces niveus]|uniref:DUF6234 family protein n=1 Tax=Streptomyces niveus TaxID=193462 RepID=UPI0036CDA891
MSNLPVAPPAFDAPVKARVQRGPDMGASCALVFLELLALAVIVVVWPFLDHFDLDPASDTETVSLWRYLPALGGVAVVAFVATVLAGRARATVTAVSQGAMAVLVTLAFFAGAALQAHQDARDRPVEGAASTGFPLTQVRAGTR